MPRSRREPGYELAKHDLHPVPHGARAYRHVGSYFASRGNRPVDKTNTGRRVALDLTRNLMPWARDRVMGTR